MPPPRQLLMGQRQGLIPALVRATMAVPHDRMGAALEIAAFDVQALVVQATADLLPMPIPALVRATMAVPHDRMGAALGIAAFDVQALVVQATADLLPMPIPP